MDDDDDKLPTPPTFVTFADDCDPRTTQLRPWSYQTAIRRLCRGTVSRHCVLLLPELLDLEILLVRSPTAKHKPLVPSNVASFQTPELPRTHVESCTMI